MKPTWSESGGTRAFGRRGLGNPVFGAPMLASRIDQEGLQAR